MDNAKPQKRFCTEVGDDDKKIAGGYLKVGLKVTSHRKKQILTFPLKFHCQPEFRGRFPQSARSAGEWGTPQPRSILGYMDLACGIGIILVQLTFGLLMSYTVCPSVLLYTGGL